MTLTAVAKIKTPAVAHLYGEPLFTMPLDLYIPPDALEVFLESFQGPLDLLLYLIRKQNFNILDIPMASVTRQYLTYVEALRKSNLELASDYLLMAAMLIEIKSRLLLPARQTADDQEAQDPRAELVRRLLEYEKTKQAALQLDALPLLDRDFSHSQVANPKTLSLVRHPDVHVNELQAVWQDLCKRGTLKQHHVIHREALSVREYMSLLLKRLQGRRFATFEELFDTKDKAPVVVVTFVAMLELSREHLLEITQAEAFAPIYVRLAYQLT
jgi:segregation and condensation protein A